ncbi:hypothetical protein QTJ16_007168 [Diplocarpon rosae]|uniref:Clr5 domain-containing protein n=1 Tax=Diplocarpon rosae TaxID=946125 RepID=A0AAD9W9U8_9HELO|nr:hypothetical protein QTJ16_007168 [Diplocarpon rosae]
MNHLPGELMAPITFPRHFATGPSDGTMPRDWRAYRAEIERLYVKEKRPLEEVRHIFREEHGFNASMRAYQMRLDDWGLETDQADRASPHARSWSAGGLTSTSKNSLRSTTSAGPGRIRERRGSSSPEIGKAARFARLTRGPFDVCSAFERLLSRWHPGPDSTLRCFQHPDYKKWSKRSNPDHGPILFKLIEALVPPQEQFELNKAFLETDLRYHSDPSYPFHAWRCAWRRLLRGENSIYPSEFGKERMEREELEGPPKEIFANKVAEEISEEDSEDDSDDEEERIKKELLKGDDGKEFDSAALRQYQLERLRYYYAVYLSSANIFDLRFVPDDTEFDEKPRDECESVPAGYKPIEFVTDALQHSKSKLTWDTNPEEASRKEAISQAFSGSKKDHLDNDLRAYLGSDSEDSEEEDPKIDGPQLSKKELARQKMRAALGLSSEPTVSTVNKSKAPVGDMEVTFTAGLTSKSSTGVFENKPPIEETTAERYKRLEKERKARRKEKAKAKREGRDPDAPVDDNAEAAEDLGFDDPFFTAEEGVKDKTKNVKKEERQQRRQAKAAAAAAKESERAGLELLMAEDTSENPGAQLEHFDINEIARAEKKKRKKGKGKKDGESKRGGLQEGFEMDVGDERFGKLFESHEFAIDPTNPKFVATEGMKKLLEEGRRKRDRGEDDGEGVKELKKSKKRKGEEKNELSGLVETIRKKVKK